MSLCEDTLMSKHSCWLEPEPQTNESSVGSEAWMLRTLYPDLTKDACLLILMRVREDVENPFWTDPLFLSVMGPCRKRYFSSSRSVCCRSDLEPAGFWMDRLHAESKCWTETCWTLSVKNWEGRALLWRVGFRVTPTRRTLSEESPADDSIRSWLWLWRAVMGK